MSQINISGKSTFTITITIGQKVSFGHPWFEEVADIAKMALMAELVQLVERADMRS